MSTVSTSGVHVPSGPEPDPFRYGWRYVKRVGPDGEETLDQIPLSLEDVLFPEMGDFIVRTDAHNSDLTSRLKVVTRLLGANKVMPSR